VQAALEANGCLKTITLLAASSRRSIHSLSTACWCVAAVSPETTQPAQQGVPPILRVQRALQGCSTVRVCGTRSSGPLTPPGPSWNTLRTYHPTWSLPGVEMHCLPGAWYDRVGNRAACL